MANVTIVSTKTVKPIGDVATGEGVLYLTAWDLVQSYRNHNKTVHFYRPPAAGMVETLRESLARALAHFYPLAGRLRWSVQDQGRLEVDCNAKGILFVEAESDHDLAYFESDMAHEKMLSLLSPVVDVDSTPIEELPLLHVQITRLRCGGAALGVGMSHVVVDGLSAFHFLTEWARLARGEPLKEAPYLDRKVLLLRASEGRRQLSFSDHQEFPPAPFLLGKQSSSDEWCKEIVKLKLSLTEAQIHALKVATAKSRASHDIDSRPYTRYEVVTAHMWRCACKARGHKEEQPTAVYIEFNVRNRIRNVPLPPRYFGNAVFKINVISKVGELISNPLGFACGKIREAISKVDEDYIWSNIELLEDQEDLSFYGLDKRVKGSASEGVDFYLGNPNLRVASWLTLPLYDLDFGWGNPVGMSPIVRDVDGSSYVVPKPNVDEGSIEVVLCFQVAHADEFKKYFYEDISINN